MSSRPLTINELQTANYERNKHWDPAEVLNGAFFATELAGEVGEACNIVKKLERERLGVPGSRDTIEHLAEELADVLICVCLLANYYDIELNDITRDKFNRSSLKLKFPVLL